MRKILFLVLVLFFLGPCGSAPLQKEEKGVVRDFIVTNVSGKTAIFSVLDRKKRKGSVTSVFTNDPLRNGESRTMVFVDDPVKCTVDLLAMLDSGEIIFRDYINICEQSDKLVKIKIFAKGILTEPVVKEMKNIKERKERKSIHSSKKAYQWAFSFFV